jgi:5'-phosphate synthase pdxT subunit
MNKNEIKDRKPTNTANKISGTKKGGIIVGVLALQGAFREHIAAFNKCGIEAREIKYPGQLEEIDAMVIPGGESTTIYKLMEKYGFRSALEDFFKSKKPIFGTCAGLVLLARKVIGEDFGYGFIDIVVDRNAYGRQVDSFESSLDFLDKKNLDHDSFNAVFIRAPIIREAGKKVDILSRLNGSIVLAKEENILVCTFHPELTDDLRVHRYFINMIKKYKNVKI